MSLSESPCRSGEGVCGDMGAKQGWYSQELDFVYFCLQLSKSAWMTLNCRWTQDSDSYVFHDGVLSREVDVDHTTFHCFSWKCLSLVILFLLNHVLMKNNRLLSKKGSMLLNT